MRILHAVHNYPPEFRGGIERVVEGLAASQRASGDEVIVLAGSEHARPLGAALEEERHEGVTVLRARRGPGLRDPIDPFRADLIPVVEAALDRAAPDVLHLHHWFNLGDDVVRRAARRSVPSVVTVHDFFPTCSLFFRVPDGRNPCDVPQEERFCVPCVGSRYHVDSEEVRFRIAMRAQALLAELRCACVVTAPSEAHARALERYLGAIGIRAVAPGSAAPAAIRPAPRTGALRVLHFGNLCRIKGVEFLAGVVRSLAAEGVPIHLTLAGPVVEPDLDTGTATCLGPFDGKQLAEAAKQSDVAVFPSFARESYSLVVDEALKLGLPVLVSDRGALAERIGSHGMALPAGDENAWKSALSRLARDPDAVRMLSQGHPAPLGGPAEHAASMRAIYEEIRGRTLPEVEIETPLVERLAHFERRLGDFMHHLTALPGSARGTEP